jgi:streptogramin lyase
VLYEAIAMRRGFSTFVAFVLLMVAFSHAQVQPATSEASGALPLYSLAQYPLPAGATGPSQIASDHAGRAWFVEQGSNQIGSYDPSSKSFSEFQIPTQDALPEGIAVDPAGEVWFAELTPNGLGMLSPENGTIKEVTIPPAPDGIGCGPIGVTPQGNGSIWVTCEFSNQIDEYVPSRGILKQFDLPVAFSAPLQVLFDRSGNFWFTAADSGMLGYATTSQLRPGTADGIEEFAPLNSTYLTTIVNPLLPGGKVVTSLAVPSQIAFSPNGDSLWVSEHGAGSFDRYGIASKTLTKYFTTKPASSLYTQSLPNGIAVDSSGLVWVAEHYGNRIAEFDPATGSMEEYPVPCCKAGIAGTLYLTTGTNGTVWFTENFGNAIGELSPMGVAAPFDVSLQPGTVTLSASGTAAVSLTVSGTGGGIGTLNFGAEGVSRDGALANLTATFDPGTLTPGGTVETATLSLTSSGLAPGVYYITVGGTSSSTGLISSAVLVVTVSQGFQSWWAVATVVILLAVAVLVAVARRVRSGTKRRGTSVLQKRPVIPVIRRE